MSGRRRYSEKTANRPNGERYDHARDSAMPLSRTGAPVVRDRDLSPDMQDDTRVRSYIQPNKNKNPFTNRNPAREKTMPTLPHPPKPRLVPPPLPKSRLSLPKLSPKPQLTPTGMYKNVKMTTIGSASRDRNRASHVGSGTGQQSRDRFSESKEAPALVTKRNSTSGPYRSSDGENHPDSGHVKAPTSGGSQEDAGKKKDPGEEQRDQRLKEGEGARTPRTAMLSRALERIGKEERAKDASKEVKKKEDEGKVLRAKKEEPYDEGYLKAQGKVTKSASEKDPAHSLKMNKKDIFKIPFFCSVAGMVGKPTTRVNKAWITDAEVPHIKPAIRAGSKSSQIQIRMGRMRRAIGNGQALQKKPRVEQPPVSEASKAQDRVNSDKTQKEPQKATNSMNKTPQTISKIGRPSTSTGEVKKTVADSASATPMRVRPATPSAGIRLQPTGATPIRKLPVPPSLPAVKRQILDASSALPLKVAKAEPSTPNRSIPVSGAGDKAKTPSRSGDPLVTPSRTPPPAEDSDDDIVFIEEILPKKAKARAQERY